MTIESEQEAREAHDREMLLDQEAQAWITVKDSCPWYRTKEDKVTTCEGDVIFSAGEFFGTCQACGRQVPLVVEM